MSSERDNKRQRGDGGAIAGAGGCMNPFPCVRLRGLPYSAQREDIADFLGITPIDIVILEKGGRPTGQALVLASNPEDMDAALEQDKKNIGARYIEVFQAIRSEYHQGVADTERGAARPFARDDRGTAPPSRFGDRGDDFRGSDRRGPPPARHSGPVPNTRGIEAVVRLRGLPFEANPVEVTAWIMDHNLRLTRPVSADDVVVATKDGQSIGIAFVEFKHRDDADRVLDLNRKYFGQRYVEVDSSSLEEQVRYTGMDV